MAKMNRRAFLKMAGLAVMAPRFLTKEAVNSLIPFPVTKETEGIVWGRISKPVIFGKIIDIKINGKPIEEFKDILIFQTGPRSGFLRKGR